MRIRRKAYSKEILAQRQDVLVNEPEVNAGNWHRLLNCQKLHVEIGSGKGAYWWQMALRQPQDGWIAIERNQNVAAMALKRLPLEVPPNLKYIAEDACDISKWFKPGEIDVIHLNFVDPWPKRAHTKRRLTHSSWLAVYKSLLSVNGEIVLKTDNKAFWEFSQSSLKAAGFRLSEYDDNYQNDGKPEEAISEYEEKFLAKGQAIIRAVWQVENEENN